MSTARPDFAQLFARSPNPYMVLDRGLRYVAANAAYERVTGRALADLLGRHVFEAFPNDPDDPNNAATVTLRESIERVLATGVADSLAFIPYRVGSTEDSDGGTERYWSATHVPLFADDGSVAFVLQHTVDVTDIHSLMEARSAAEGPRVSKESVGADVLRRAKAVQATNRDLDLEVRDLRQMFVQAPGFMCFLRGPTHVFELANAAYFQVVGHRPILGKTVRAALPELAGQGFFELLDRVYATGEPFVGTGADVMLQREPGAPLEHRTLDFVYQPIVGPDGAVLGIFVQGNDITEQKRLELERAALLEREQAARAEAERATRLKDEFLATVSHELRTPLTSMLGWVQMLRAGRLPDEQRPRALETIERNARAQAQLIDDLLDVSGILAGKLRLDVESTDVGAVVWAAVESVRVAADARGIRLQPTLDSSAHVMGDHVRLQQIVWNLLSNAVKFTPKGGSVRVVVARVASSVEVTVRDSGQGIAADFLPYVFERFRQSEGSITRKHGGLGLGLAIVKQLVELHGGTVSVESPGEGLGSTFTVRLPLAAARRADLHRPSAEPAAPASLAAVATSQLAGVRVVVVDDEPDTRDLTRALLEGCGAVVEVAGSAAEGLALLRRVRPDLLLSDIGMPDEDGYAFIRKVRALPAEEGGRTPAVALTAYARTEDRTRALVAGFKAHVPKPIEPAELVAVLASLLPARDEARG